MKDNYFLDQKERRKGVRFDSSCTQLEQKKSIIYEHSTVCLINIYIVHDE